MAMTPICVSKVFCILLSDHCLLGSLFSLGREERRAVWISIWIIDDWRDSIANVNINAILDEPGS